MKWEAVSLRFGGGNPGRMSQGGCFSLFYLCPSIGPILVSQTSNSSRQIRHGMGGNTHPPQEEVLAVLSLERHPELARSREPGGFLFFVSFFSLEYLFIMCNHLLIFENQVCWFPKNICVQFLKTADLGPGKWSFLPHAGLCVWAGWKGWNGTWYCWGWCGLVGITVPTSALTWFFDDCPHRVTTQPRMEC